MTYNSIKNMSVSLSLLFHLLLLGLFMLLNFTITYPPRKYVEVTFGQSGGPGSSGAMGSQIDKVEQVAKKQEQTEAKEKQPEVKKVDLPKAVNTSEDNTVNPAVKNKAKDEKVKSKSEQTVNSNVNSEGQGNKTSGNGSFGFGIDWGGRGQRKIYSYILPTYPEGVDKEIDIRLRFSIMPDGTVGTIVPLIKADTRLENAAINSLRQWRFEPLDPSQKQVPQTAVIVFPYRLQ